jgi:multicomponent Na+:H+ antiporter subunit D
VITQHLPALIPVIFMLAALLVPLAGMRKKALGYAIALGGTFLGALASAWGLWHVVAEGTIRYAMGGWVAPIGIEYVLDPLSAFVATVITGVTFFVLVHARHSVQKELPGRTVPYYSVVMLLLAGLTGIVVTGDIFNLYVFLEISSLASYALLGIGERRSPVAAYRYLLLGTLGASFYLIGVGFVYVSTGSLNIADLALILPSVQDQSPIIVGLALMVAGIAVKMALFPLHGWLPDAYTYAPSASSALIAPIGTKVAAYVLLRILFYMFEPSFVRDELPLLEAIAWMSAAAIIFGSVMAIAQRELKRMLAYSSVAQVGYIGLGIGLANPLGFIGAVLHILNHAVMKACLFLVSGNLRARLGHSDITRFDNKLRRAMPWTMAAYTVAALSMIGIPPTAGFFSKWYLALGAIEEGRVVFIIVIMASSLLNAVYFWRILERVYLPPVPGDEVKGAPLPSTHAVGEGGEAVPSMLIPTLVLGFGLLALGLMNAFIVNEVITLMLPAGMR